MLAGHALPSAGGGVAGTTGVVTTQPAQFIDTEIDYFGNFVYTEEAFSVREALPTLGVPVCVVWGAEDRIVPATHASGLEDPVVVHVIEGAGHMVHMEKAAEVSALIESTMARSG